MSEPWDHWQNASLPELELPEPAGRNVLGAEAYWRLSSGELLFVNAGQVYGSGYDKRSLDQREQDALAALAAARWARGLVASADGEQEAG